MIDTAIDIADGNIAEARRARPRASGPNPSPPAGMQRDWKRNLARGATTYRRCSRQNRSTSAPAPRPAVRGASKATRRHGTWLLTHTQQITVLSKHLPSKQRLNPANKILAGQPIRTSQFAGDAPQRRHETDIDQILAHHAALRPDHADQRLGTLVRPDRCDQDPARLEPLRQRLGNLLHGGGDHDAVEAAGAGRNIEAIPEHYLDIVAAELFESQPGTVGERPVTLDRQHFPAQPRQDGGLIPGAGA